MAIHHVAEGKQMLIVGPAKVDIRGATYEKHFKEKDFVLPEEPTLSSINPSSAVIGGEALTLEAIGSGFTEESVIVFNGGEEATTFVDETRLTTGVQPSTAGTPGGFPVLVRTFTHETAPQTFSFTEAARSSRKR
jgi:IPT/TIG domain